MFVNSSGSKLTDITGKWDFKIKYVSGFNNMVIVSHTFRRLLFWIICRLPKKEHKKENKYPQQIQRWFNNLLWTRCNRQRWRQPLVINYLWKKIMKRMVINTVRKFSILRCKAVKNGQKRVFLISSSPLWTAADQTTEQLRAEVHSRFSPSRKRRESLSNRTYSLLHVLQKLLPEKKNVLN